MSQLAEAQESLRDAEHQMRRSEHRGRNGPGRRGGAPPPWDWMSRDELVRNWWGMVGEFSEFMVSG